MIKILSFDGGPGPLVQIRVLEQLQVELERQRASILDGVELIAGTSAGGIMALFLAMELTKVERGESKKTPLEILQSCREFSDAYGPALAAEMSNVGRWLLQFGATLELTMAPGKKPGTRLDFVMQRLQTIAQGWAAAPGALVDLWKMRGFLWGSEPASDGSVFRGVLEKHFGAFTIGELTKKVAILSFDTQKWAPRAFRNFGVGDPDGENDARLNDSLTLVDVALCTASLPVLLPIFGGPGSRGYFDGIFSANNPSTSALSLAIRHLVDPGEKNPLEQVTLLSLGVSQTAEEAMMERLGGLLPTLVLLLVNDRDTRLVFFAGDDLMGYLTDYRVRQKVYGQLKFEGVGAASWGWGDVVKRPTFIGNLLIHGMNREADKQCSRLLVDRYFRFRPRINLARGMFRGMVLGQEVEETDLPWNAKRCFREQFETLPPSTDEKVNADRLDDLRAWLKKQWLQPSRGAPADAPAATA